ncbi:hypothetical protein CHS0354_024055 [Potamilus streckersoni]|uniref:3-hydroxyacyl-CoA dehydrogenase NAD binding domain-containing protein n=1 Tax=Potamilus streckersoni TaxID=2493646 RepID=A0AAE0RZG8_9BIVA|nr:hypothetical protein CHS0354_024055 [Potamilus streckersoni]
MKRNLDKVAVLGAGVMGSRIACLFAGTGHRVLLLDIAHTSEDKNKLVVDAIHAAFTSNPKSLYDESFRERITVGTFNDDMHKIKECEWIIEAVTENLKIKKSLLKQVDTHRTKGTIVTSNTSGIPLRMMCEDLSEDFKQHFCGSHFFNPPRYVPLLEIIPIATTKPDVISFLTSYGFNRLGKEVILCKDTPGFIANRIGIYSMLATVKTGFDLDLSIGEIDDLTGKIIGRAKSATFRTADIVGIDTFVYVANNLYSMLLNDESRDMFTLPTGFYKKDKVKGKSNILELNVKTNEYQMRTKANFPSFKQAKESGGDLNNKLNLLFNAKDKSGEFFRKMFSETFRYASMRMPDAAESIIDIDKAIGLVETGVGLIPAGGGTKELAHLASERYFKGDVEINIVEKYFKQIALATVSTSAYDAVKLGYLHPNYITFNRQKLIYDAKKLALLLAEIYIKPQPPLIRVQGATGLAAIEASIVGMFTAGYISEYDAKIARKLAYGVCGGDLSRPQYVTEDYMLNLEREAFLSLTGEQKTQERIHSILFNRKPLRN